MKLIAYLPLFFILSFWQKPKPNHNIGRTPAFSILGKWTMCKTTLGSGENESTLMKNVCTAWMFKHDQSGLVGLQIPKYRFNWKIIGNTLYIKTLDKNAPSVFKDGLYKITEEKNTVGRTITIADTVNNIKYFLSR